MLLVTRRNQFWRTWRKFFDKKREFSHQVPKVTKKIPKKIISLNGSYKHVEWPFDDPGELFLPESKIFLFESPRVINKTLQLLQNLFNSNSSSGHEKFSFDHPVDNFLTKSRRAFAQCPKMIGRKITADTSSQNDAIASWNAVPTTQSYNFRKKSGNFHSLSEQENVRFSSESVSAHLVPMYTWKSVLINLWESLLKMTMVFCPTSENYTKLQNVAMET